MNRLRVVERRLASWEAVRDHPVWADMAAKTIPKLQLELAGLKAMSDNQTKLDAVERELRFRRRVYPRRVDDGKLSERTAATQIAIFEEIAADYRRLVEGERLL